VGVGIFGRLVAENSLFHAIGQIFHPVFVLFATILAFIYGIVPNYAIAIALLTVLIMAALAPLTVKSTKSMLAMQRLQPEIKRLQQKYKGAENRQQQTEELMKLYKEHGVSPAGGCLPLLIQMPFLLVLYDVIKGITSNPPNYISHSSKMFHDLCPGYTTQHPHCNGPVEMVSFGINLALKPFSPHPSIWAAIPFFVIVGVAVALQYVQMNQMNKRNPQAAAANPQMKMMTRIMPIIFAYIYFLVPAAVVIYMIVSTIIRIGIQDVIFRTGIVKPAGESREPGSRAGPIDATSQPVERPKGIRAALAGMTGALTGGTVEDRGKGEAASGTEGAGKDASSDADGGGRSGDGKAGGQAPKPGVPQRPSSGRSPNGSSSRRPGGRTGGSAKGNTTGSTNGDGAKPHPRSKDKRERKTR
jgi:YidC/Oxa1 family membrane protein insertase